MQAAVVVLWANAIGVVGSGILALALSATISSSGVWWCAAAGFASCIAFVTFYAALAAGSMSLVAPIVACGAAVPALVAVAGGDQLTGMLSAGLLVALVGSALAAKAPPDGAASTDGVPARLSRRAVVLAVAASLLVGVSLTLLQQATASPGTGAVAVIAVTRGFSLCFLLAAFAATRMPAAVPRDLRRDVVTVGVADTSANLMFVTASAGGSHAVAAVLSSLYPVGTVALGYLLLRERLGSAQWMGVVLALLGVALVSAGR